jgi:hypothetical protein
LTSGNTEIKVGMEVFGAAFLAAGTTVTKVNSATEVEVEEAAKKSESGTFEFETTLAKHRIRFRVACHTKAEVVEASGELHPLAKNNGTVIGAAPSELEFKGATSGELESSAGTITVTGSLKLMGSEGGAIIKIKRI